MRLVETTNANPMAPKVARIESNAVRLDPVAAFDPTHCQRRRDRHHFDAALASARRASVSRLK